MPNANINIGLLLDRIDLMLDVGNLVPASVEVAGGLGFNIKEM